MSKSVLNKKMVEIIIDDIYGRSHFNCLSKRKEVIKFSRKYTVYRLRMR